MENTAISSLTGERVSQETWIHDQLLSARLRGAKSHDKPEKPSLDDLVHHCKEELHDLWEQHRCICAGHYLAKEDAACVRRADEIYANYQQRAEAMGYDWPADRFNI